MSDDSVDVNDAAVTGRRRSFSAPQRYRESLAPPGTDLSRQRTAEPHMRTINEGQALPQAQDRTPYYESQETPRPYTPSINIQTPGETPQAERMAQGAPVVANAGEAARRNRGLRRFRSSTQGYRHQHMGDDEYDADVVDLLDLVGKSEALLDLYVLSVR